MGKRTVVIGLDGFTFSVVDRLVETGRMPVFERLMREGVRAPLRSTVMPNSFPGWTSCTTGCNEGKHAIFMPLVRREDNFSMKAMDSTDIRMKTVWEILSDLGRRSIVVNDPCSYPPQSIDGVVVSGMTTPEPSVSWTHPEEVKRQLLERVPNYVVDVNLYGKPRRQILHELKRSASARLEAARFLIERDDWDLFWVTFTESDRVQHRFWADQQPDHPHHVAEFPDAVDEIYCQLDAAVGEIVERMPKDATLFLVSDHGFAPFYCTFDITGWLIDSGYTVQHSTKAGIKRTLARLGMLDGATHAYRRLRRLIEAEERHGIDHMKDRASSANSGRIYTGVDWAETRAYATLDGGIRVNVRGREPHGIVPQSEARALTIEIRNALTKLRFPNGEPVYEDVLLADEAFSGPFADRGPDIVMPVRSDAYHGPVEGHRFLTDRHRNSGEHARYGIFVAWGSDIALRGWSDEPNLVDIAPTVLFSLGEQPTVEMDGRVLIEVFEERIRRSRRVEPRGSSAKDPDAFATGLDPDEEMLVEQRLRGLGYIE